MKEYFIENDTAPALTLQVKTHHLSTKDNRLSFIKEEKAGVNKWRIRILNSKEKEFLEKAGIEFKIETNSLFLFSKNSFSTFEELTEQINHIYSKYENPLTSGIIRENLYSIKGYEGITIYRKFFLSNYWCLDLYHYKFGLEEEKEAIKEMNFNTRSEALEYLKYWLSSQSATTI